MTQFDMEFRRGLMDANLAQYKKVLAQADSMEPDFSPRYLRERTRMLSDPWGWVRRRSRGKRLDWKLVAIVAALLLLSACAYAVATGQFSQWFPRRGVDPKAPEVSEEVLSRVGTAIEQSQTVGDDTMTLNAAMWDGTNVWLSFVIESPNLPDEVKEYTPLYTTDCRLILRDDQWEEMWRNLLKEHYAGTDMSPEEVEKAIQAELDSGDRKDGLTILFADQREGDALFFEVNEMLLSRAFTETTRPELTLHIENIAIYANEGIPVIDENGYAQSPGPGELFIKGPFDFTFTLEEPILPIRYGGADVEVETLGVPLRFTGFRLSATEVTGFYEALNPVELPQPGETLTPEETSRIDKALMELLHASSESIDGLWRSEGDYVDLTASGGSGDSDSVSSIYPYPIDPATVTALNIGGVRVELGELEVLDE